MELHDSPSSNTVWPPHPKAFRRQDGIRLSPGAPS
jgi:hypothetical protein